MIKKTYPKTIKKWVEHLTIDNYYTPKEIEYRKELIVQSDCDYEEVWQKIMQYRKKNQKELINLQGDAFYFVQTIFMRSSLEKIKKFWGSGSYSFRNNYKKELIFDTLISEFSSTD